MFTTGSKFFVGLSALGAVSFAVYMVLLNPSSIGATALFGFVPAVALAAWLALWSRDGEPDESSPASAVTPSAGMWPFVAAVGTALTLVGTVTRPIVLILGGVVVASALVEWAVQSWSDRASADPAHNADLRGRIMQPLEFPVLATIGAGVVVVAFSQIMLAISKSAGAVAFIVLSSLVLLGGVLFALRPGLKRSLVAGICTVGAVGIVAGGIGGASAGLRPDLVEAREEGHYTHRKCGPEKDKYGDKHALLGVSSRSAVIATVEFVDGALVARVQGNPAETDRITVPRSNPSSIIFRNKTEGDFRLVARLGTVPVTEGVVENVEQCTQLIPNGAEQLLTLTIPKPSLEPGAYVLEVPGVEGQSIEVVVP
jgi:hypothetical protein